MTDLKLRLQTEGQPETLVTVDRDEFTIGRLPECNLYLPYFNISRYHARFFKTTAGQWCVEDLGSTNGTRLNELIVTSPQVVKHGDRLQLGQTYISILFSLNQAARQTKVDPVSGGVTIFRNAEELQQQWIQADCGEDTATNPQKAIARLKDLVDIAKGLNSAESIEAIFQSVQAVVFRDLISIERLALLVDVNHDGQLELLNSAVRDPHEQQTLARDGSWISRAICKKVFEEKVGLKTADAQEDERFEGEHSILAKGIRGALAVPLWNENQVVGVLYGDARLSLHQWNRGGDEDLSFFSALANLVASAVQRWLLVEKLKGQELIRTRLERYHSPAVVQHIMAVGGLEDGRLIPTEGEISILFADLVGFTALSERLSPAEISKLLNRFFEEMLQPVFGAGGTLDKFIGDCIMAFFGAPEPQSDHADRALAAAWGMLERLDYLNTCKVFPEPLQIRVAINSGKALVGDVGSPQRVDYTVLGATINLASRMEGICPPGECVLSEATHALLTRKQNLLAMGEFRFKGIERPIGVYQTKRR